MSDEVVMTESTEKQCLLKECARFSRADKMYSELGTWCRTTVVKIILGCPHIVLGRQSGMLPSILVILPRLLLPSLPFIVLQSEQLMFLGI